MISKRKKRSKAAIAKYKETTRKKKEALNQMPIVGSSGTATEELVRAQGIGTVERTKYFPKFVVKMTVERIYSDGTYTKEESSGCLEGYQANTFYNSNK